MAVKHTSFLKRLGVTLVSLFFLRGEIIAASPEDRYYTRSGRPDQYTTLDPYLAGTLLDQLNTELAQGRITFEQYRNAQAQMQHGVRTETNTRRLPVPTATSLPTPTASNSCDGILDCGSCLYHPTQGWDKTRCVPGDTSVFMGCHYESCGEIPEGYACGTRQPGPSGYEWPCKEGLVCRRSPEPLGATYFAGVCRVPDWGSVVGDGEIGGIPSHHNAIAAKYFTGNYKMVMGFEMDNLMDPKMQSPKYVFIRTVQDMGLLDKGEETRHHLQQVVDVLRERGFPDAKVMGHDKIYFDEIVGIIDVITAQGKWWWGYGASSPLEGYDQDKLDNPSVRTPKYMFGRLVQYLALDAPSHRGNLNSLVSEMHRRHLFPLARVVDVDKIDFGGDVGVVDVLNSNGNWWWGPVANWYH